MDQLWIARDQNGTLGLYLNKPGLYNDDGGEFYWRGYGGWMIETSLYPNVDFENSPQRLIPENSKND